MATRRAHNKSRLGCHQCKRRRIKVRDFHTCFYPPRWNYSVSHKDKHGAWHDYIVCIRTTPLHSADDPNIWNCYIMHLHCSQVQLYLRDENARMLCRVITRVGQLQLTPSRPGVSSWEPSLFLMVFTLWIHG